MPPSIPARCMMRLNAIDRPLFPLPVSGEVQEIAARLGYRSKAPKSSVPPIPGGSVFSPSPWQISLRSFSARTLLFSPPDRYSTT